MKFMKIFVLFAMVLFVFSSCSKTEENTNNNNDVQIANPASTFCVENGGKLDIQDTETGQVGICTFSNGKQCEEWSYYRGECSSEYGDGRVYCTPEDKENYGCYMEYNPVCAYFDSTIKCSTDLCSATESTACDACLRPHVDYYIEGICPDIQ